MPIPLIHPENQPDSHWPFKMGQLVRSKHGYYYNVVKCEWDDYSYEWWITIENEILGLKTDVRVPYVFRCVVSQQNKEKLFQIIGGNDLAEVIAKHKKPKKK